MAPRLTQRTSLSRSLKRGLHVLSWITPGLSAMPASAAEDNAKLDAHPTDTTPNANRAALVAECVDAHAAAQEHRQSGQLLQSRARFLRCSKQDCPEVVRSECMGMLDELRAQVPSVAFRITLDGQPRSDVEATMDGQKLFSELPTRALDLDPGKHHFVFRSEGLEPIEHDVTISEGQKLVPIVVEFTTPTRPRRSPVPLTAPEESTPIAVETRPIPLPVYVLAGLGVVGLGGFIGFGVATRSKESELRSTCMPACAPSEIDELERRARIADISLGVGAVGLAAATAYYLLRPTESVQVGAVVLPNARVQSQIRFDF